MNGYHDLYPRETRLLRAVNDVLKKYSIRRVSAEGPLLNFRVSGGNQPYEVQVYADWSGPPSCTCPDFGFRATRDNRGYCKHIIAVLYSNPELKCQLLEIFL